MRDIVRNALWEVVARLDAGDVLMATSYLLALHPTDQAEILMELDGDERDRLAVQLTSQQLAEVLEHLSPPQLAELAQLFSPERLAAVLNRTSGTAARNAHRVADAPHRPRTARAIAFRNIRSPTRSLRGRQYVNTCGEARPMACQASAAGLLITESSAVSA